MEYGVLSLLPPLVAIVLAVLTRRVILALALGVGVGAYLLASEGSAWWQPAVGFAVAIRDSIFAHDHMQAFAFSLLLGAMVGVLEAGGAMESHVANSPTSSIRPPPRSRACP